MNCIFVEHDFEPLFSFSPQKRARLLALVDRLTLAQKDSALCGLSRLQQTYEQMNDGLTNQLIEDLRPVVARGVLTEALRNFLTEVRGWNQRGVNQLKENRFFFKNLAELCLERGDEIVWKALPKGAEICALLENRLQICAEVYALIEAAESPSLP